MLGEWHPLLAMPWFRLKTCMFEKSQVCADFLIELWIHLQYADPLLALPLTGQKLTALEGYY